MAEGKTEETRKNEEKQPEIKSAEGTPVDKLEKERQAIFDRLQPIHDQAVVLSNLRHERDALNNKVKILSEEVRAKKAERDELNKHVKEEKDKRDNINKQASTLRKDFKVNFGDLPPKKGSFELQKLRKMVKDRRWEIETAGCSFAEEKKKRKVLDELEKKLKAMEKLDNARVDVVRRDKEAREFHSHVIEYSKKSEEVHQALIVLYEKLKEAREKADGKHNDVVTALDALKKIELERADDIKRFEELRGVIKETKEELEERKAEESKKSAKERGAEAYAEFEKGERVDFRELQLRFLGEKGKNREEEEK